MKRTILLICLLGTTIAACKNGGHHTEITENNNGEVIKIEYSGKVAFNDDATAIRQISPNGYLKYRNREDILVAESDNRGVITYEMNDGGKQHVLDKPAKEFLTLAIKDILKRRPDGYNGLR